MDASYWGGSCALGGRVMIWWLDTGTKANVGHLKSFVMTFVNLVVKLFQACSFTKHSRARDPLSKKSLGPLIILFIVNSSACRSFHDSLYSADASPSPNSTQRDHEGPWQDDPFPSDPTCSISVSVF